MTATQTKPATPEQLKKLARAIDHTKLTFNAGENEEEAIQTLCAEAKEHGFYAVCVRPRHVDLALQELAESRVKVATVIGFPLEKVDLNAERQNPTVGNFSTDEKIAETRQAVADGADEFDLVLNVGLFKREAAAGSDYPQTTAELAAIVEAVDGCPVKVIIETDLLSEEEIEAVTRLCVQAGAKMVKTSTGMVSGGEGATSLGVSIIWQTIDELEADTQIKASGGIKTQQQAIGFLRQGVSRLGTSSGVSLIQTGQANTDY